MSTFEVKSSRFLVLALALAMGAAVLLTLNAPPASAACDSTDYHTGAEDVASGAMRQELDSWHDEMVDRGLWNSGIHYGGDRDIAESYGWLWDEGTCTFVWQTPPTTADIVILGGESAISTAVESQLASCTTGSVIRIAGANRYATAAAVSEKFLDSSVEVIYVATGENFPDALAGSAAAGAGVGGPVLLVRRTSLPSDTRAELKRLKPTTIVVLGGEAAISAEVESSLRAYGTVVRVAGTNRYSTGALVSSYAFPAGVQTAYIATGTNFPDALAGGPASVVARGPVLLVDPDRIPASVKTELARLNLVSIKVLGGSAAISTSVESQLRAYADNVSRLSGSNRYSTAAAVSGDTFAAGVDVIFIATGTNFPDALAGAPIAGILEGPILLTGKDTIPRETKAEIERLAGRTCSSS